MRTYWSLKAIKIVYKTWVLVCLVTKPRRRLVGVLACRSSPRSGRFILAGKSPRYQLIRRLDVMSLASAGNRAPILQYAQSSEHLDLGIKGGPNSTCSVVQVCALITLLPERGAVRYITYALSWSQFGHTSSVPRVLKKFCAFVRRESNTQLLILFISSGWSPVFHCGDPGWEPLLHTHMSSGAGTVGLFETALPRGSVSLDMLCYFLGIYIEVSQVASYLKAVQLKPVCVSHFSYSCYMLHSYHSSWFDSMLA
jgi:hypothetical protein